MSCNELLKAEGKSYPRQCAKCKFGPCTERPKEPDASVLLKNIAGLLQRLPYRDMTDFAQQVASKFKERDDVTKWNVTNALLATSDDILNAKTPESK